MRDDWETAKLAHALPNYSPEGMWLLLFPLWIYHRVSGESLGYPRMAEPGNEDIRDVVIARTVYIDTIIEEAVDAVDQVVLMGAGYDTRAYGKLVKGRARVVRVGPRGHSAPQEGEYQESRNLGEPRRVEPTACGRSSSSTRTRWRSAPSRAIVS